MKKYLVVINGDLANGVQLDTPQEVEEFIVNKMTTSNLKEEDFQVLESKHSKKSSKDVKGAPVSGTINIRIVNANEADEDDIPDFLKPLFEDDEDEEDEDDCECECPKVKLSVDGETLSAELNELFDVISKYEITTEIKDGKLLIDLGKMIGDNVLISERED